jgi:hypothetical protein
VCTCAFGQKTPTSKDTLWLGDAELSLGLPRDLVISRLSEKNNIVKIDEDENTLSIRTKTPPYDVSGEVVFRNGRLVYAMRDWSSDPDAVSFLYTLRSVLIHFGNEGKHMCLVSTGGSQGPDGQTQSIAMVCGAKRLIMSVNEIFPGPQKGKSISLQEEIGSLD